MAHLISCLRKQVEEGNRVIYGNDASQPLHAKTNTVTNTKYTFANFIPKNLYEQFSRPMNCYFLFIACLQLIRDITPVNPLTTWLPLAVIFGVTAVKEGIDDWGRAKADKAANAREYEVVRAGQAVKVPSHDIRVGDILRLKENEEVPADCVLLSSSDPAGNAYIQTTNLDGESNLKVRTAVAATKVLTTEHALGSFKGSVECAAPNEHIYSFDSQLRPEGASGPVLPLSSSQLLLQATHLRNTEWAAGLVVYTGNETKFGKNKKTPPTKYTRADGFINAISVFIFIFQLFLVLVFGLVGDDFTRKVILDDWYFRWGKGEFAGITIIVIPARFLLLNSTMIPISLKLTMDLCKLFYAKFIDADLALYDEEGDTPAHSNSTALSEDLGQVRYVLTDKTGTLTENRMVLKAAMVGAARFGADPTGAAQGPAMTAAEAAAVGAPLAAAAGSGIMADAALFRLANASTGVEAVRAREFLRCLALNNDVVPGAHKEGVVAHGAGSALFPRVYKASSPDEEALVKSASAYGVHLWTREGDQVVIRVGGGAAEASPSEQYTQLAAFEFTSDRKRMSVLLRMPASQGGGLRLYVKGADDMVMARLAKEEALNPAALVTSIQTAVDAYAELGLRTLVYGYRDVPESEYAAWKASYDEAAAAMADRDAAKERVYALMEKDVVLLGATAIEDKLQDGVPDTIRLLKKAGVSFWMLTGDKFSTALTIAGTAALKPRGNALITIEGDDKESTAASVEEAYRTLAAQGHDLRYELEPTFADNARALLNGTYFTRRPPPQPYTSSEADDANGGSGGEEGDAASPDAVAVRMEGESTPAVTFVPHAGGRGKGMKGDARVPFTVIVRGSTVEHALNDPALLKRFAAVACAADSLIACRVTPKQKGQMVRLVKAAGHLTLAIGDGGNDVAMIQEASVGVGIVGKEGLQAARASDYAVPFFRALQRLLLIHGRYSYTRTASVAQYSFYKSLLFCFVQIGYGFFSGFAGVSLFNSICVAAYNAVLFVPIVFFLVDKDISQATALALPQAYLPCSNGDYMTLRTMGLWGARALWQAIVLLLLSIYGNSVTRSGDYESLGLLVFMAYMWGQDFTMLFTLRRVTVYNVVSIFGMHAVAFIVGYATNATTRMQSFIDYGSFTNTLKDPSFWLTSLLVAAAQVLPVQALVWWDTAYGSGFTNKLYRLDRRIEADAAAGGSGSGAEASGANAKVPLLSSEQVAASHGGGASESAALLPTVGNPLKKGGLKGGGVEGAVVQNPARARGAAAAGSGSSGTDESVATSSGIELTDVGVAVEGEEDAKPKSSKSKGKGKSKGRKVEVEAEEEERSS